MRRRKLVALLLSVGALAIPAAPAVADPDFGPGNSSKGPNDGGAKCHPPGQTVNANAELFRIGPCRSRSSCKLPMPVGQNPATAPPSHRRGGRRRRLSVSCRRCWTNRPGFTGVPIALVGGVLTLFVLPTLYARYGGRPRNSAPVLVMAG